MLCLCILITLALSACSSTAVYTQTEPGQAYTNGAAKNNTDIVSKNIDAVKSEKEESWKAIQVTVDSKWQQKYPEAQVMTWETMQQAIEDLKALTKSEGYIVEDELQKLSYSQSDFEKKSIIAYHYKEPLSCSIRVKDVKYSDEEVKIILEMQAPPQDSLQVAAFTYQCVFLEIEEKIPNSTSISVGTVFTE